MKIFLAGSCNTFKTAATREYASEKRVLCELETSENLLKKAFGHGMAEMLRRKNVLYTKSEVFEKVVDDWLAAFEAPVMGDCVYSESPLTFLDHSLMYGLLGKIPLGRVEAFLTRALALVEESDSRHIVVIKDNASGMFEVGGNLATALAKGLCDNAVVITLSGTPSQRIATIKAAIDEARGVK